MSLFKPKLLNFRDASGKIVTDDLWEDDILILKGRIIIKYIGNVDTRTNDCFLFKTLYSPFATTKWIEMNRNQVENLKVIVIRH